MMCSVTVIDDNRGVPQENLLPATQFPERRGRGGGEEEGRGTERERERPKEKEFAQDELFLHSALFLQFDIQFKAWKSSPGKTLMIPNPPLQP